MDLRSFSPDSIYLFFTVFERKFGIEADFFPVMRRLPKSPDLPKIDEIQLLTTDYTDDTDQFARLILDSSDSSV
jgi:hypothetical protein